MKSLKYHWYKFWASRNEDAIKDFELRVAYERKSLEKNLQSMNQASQNNSKSESRKER